MTSQSALITGICGQDGPYLAGHLAAAGWDVCGMVRGQPRPDRDEVCRLVPGLTLHEGDLLDQSSLQRVLAETRPDVVFNLAALTFVPLSFRQPVLTADVTGTGVIRLLEAIRVTDPSIRLVQASSSEMFGNAVESPQHELTRFSPASPYAAAKALAHHAVANYRDSYGLHASTAIMFNHECVAANTPLMVRENNVLAIRTPADLVPLRRKGRSVQAFEPSGLEVWTGGDWTAVRAITATRRRQADPDHAMLSVEARGGVVRVTAHHTMLSADRSGVKARDLTAGDELLLCDTLPATPGWTAVTAEMAELLGMLAADGYIDGDGHHICFTNNDPELRHRAAELWSKTFLGASREWAGRSGFDKNVPVWKINLTEGGSALAMWLRGQLYTRTGHKQVPPVILNSGRLEQEHFIRGYYAGDGLKRGKGDSVTTNSPVLAQGLVCLYHNAGQPASVYAEHRGERSYYHLNLASAATGSKRPRFPRLPSQEIRQVRADMAGDDEWVFDIETEAGVLSAGVGRLVIRNSPRRGPEFVTRKISLAVAAIRRGDRDELALGRLDTRRDWGWAPEYMAALPLIAERDEPDDFVLATGESHSVLEFAQAAFAAVGLDWAGHLRSDPALFRPADVSALEGDPGKAREVLGWKASVPFGEIARRMVMADLTEGP